MEVVTRRRARGARLVLPCVLTLAGVAGAQPVDPRAAQQAPLDPDAAVHDPAVPTPEGPTPGDVPPGPEVPPPAEPVLVAPPPEPPPEEPPPPAPGVPHPTRRGESPPGVAHEHRHSHRHVHEEAPSYQTTVSARRPITAASSTSVRDRDFLLRPHVRPADLLQVAPGLVVLQHAGGGKANQYFLRGFDIDHGTDLAIYVDGVPVNMVSHGHGQGYADMHWIIPELIRRVEVFKGPYFAEYGDLATAGAVNLITHDHDSMEHSSITLSGGMFNSYRGLVIASPRFEGWHPLFAAEAYGTDGPFERGEDLQRYNVFGRITRDAGPRSSFGLTVSSYGGGWHASGQLPRREVEAGTLDRFGTLDPTDGGNSQRHGVQALYRAAPTDDSQLSLMAYLTHYRLALFSNFTFFSRDPENGDQIEQNDARTIWGVDARYRFRRALGSIRYETMIGAGVRNDLIANTLNYTRAREILERVARDNVREGSLFLYGQEDVAWAPWLRSVIGVRADYFGFDVADRLEDDDTFGDQTSGVRQASLLSPKANLIATLIPELDLFANFGMGFHSNDARGVVRAIDPVKPLTRATGYEVGARTRLFDERLDLAGSAFLVDMDSEIVWVGDEGTTEARGPTRRFGGEAEARLKILPWLFADLDATFTHAEFTELPDGEDAVPLAPVLTVSGGLSARHPLGPYGRLGFIHVGDRPATEDRFLTAEGFTRLDATVGYHHKRFDVSLAVENVLGTEWSEAQFGNVSRLPGETEPADCSAGTRAVGAGADFEGCEDIHFTPGTPFQIQATATAYF